MDVYKKTYLCGDGEKNKILYNIKKYIQKNRNMLS